VATQVLAFPLVILPLAKPWTDTVPYWEWGLDVNDPAASPVFDGSDTSLGGNGDYIPHAGMILAEPLNPSALIPLPPGSGGGCVTTGPFANMVVNIGAVALAQYGTTAAYSSANPLGDGNQRCLKRDLNAGIAKRYTSFLNTTTLILNNHNIEMFQAVMQADPRYVHGELGVHGGGHFTIGGDPGSDPFISPGDPAFFLHHSQIDRIYWIWQMLDFPNRQVSISLPYSAASKSWGWFETGKEANNENRMFLAPVPLWTSSQRPMLRLTTGLIFRPWHRPFRSRI
jgi:tyrosinase